MKAILINTWVENSDVYDHLWVDKVRHQRADFVTKIPKEVDSGIDAHISMEL
jgi:hypothetical protein